MMIALHQIRTSRFVLLAAAGSWGLLSVIPNQAALLLLVLGCLTFSAQHIRKHRVFLLILGQYFILQLVLNLYHDGDLGQARLNDSYMLMGISALVMLPLALQITKDVSLWHNGLIIGLWGSLFLLAAHYFGLISSATCRAYVAAFNPLVSPFLLILTVPFLFAQWADFSPSRRKHSIAAYAAVGAGIFCFTGSRMATYTFIISIPFLACFIWRCRTKSSDVFALIGGVLIAFLLACGIDIMAGCNSILRIAGTFDSITFLAENLGNWNLYTGRAAQDIIADGMSKSDGLRFVLWNAGIESVQIGPFLGYGQSQEHVVINTTAQTGLPHVHNQFLSWAIWGGIPGLISGCLFGLAALFTKAGRGIVPIISLGLAGMILMTDSLLAWPIVLHATVPILIFGYALSVNTQRTEQTKSEL